MAIIVIAAVYLAGASLMKRTIIRPIGFTDDQYKDLCGLYFIRVENGRVAISCFFISYILFKMPFRGIFVELARAIGWWFIAFGIYSLYSFVPIGMHTVIMQGAFTAFRWISVLLGMVLAVYLYIKWDKLT